MARVMIGPCVSSRGWVWAKKKKKERRPTPYFYSMVGSHRIAELPTVLQLQIRQAKRKK